VSSHDLFLALHLIVIALGVGFSASNFINTRLSLGQGGELAKGLALHRRTIARLGDGILALIWVSGLLLLWQHGTDALPLAFHAKIVFVVALTVFHGIGRSTGEKMRREGNLQNLPFLSLLIGAGAASALLALICAILAFSA
jgi:uncharacterized membrane protein